MPGGSEDPDAAGAVLNDSQDVGLRAVEQVGGEEVQRKDPLCLGPQELRPARSLLAAPATRGPATSDANEHEAARAGPQRADAAAQGSRRPSTTTPAATTPAVTRHG